MEQFDSIFRHSIDPNYPDELLVNVGDRGNISIEMNGSPPMDGEPACLVTILTKDQFVEMVTEILEWEEANSEMVMSNKLLKWLRGECG